MIGHQGCYSFLPDNNTKCKFIEIIQTYKAVFPSLSAAFGFALFANRSFVIWVCPWLDARCRGVLEYLSAMLTSAPLSNSTSAIWNHKKNNKQSYIQIFSDFCWIEPVNPLNNWLQFWKRKEEILLIRKSISFLFKKHKKHPHFQLNKLNL